ncbi:MAG: hypothetical protein GAK31_02489 [Stenotrophomonas maltophilia]|uniref:GYF domain-containing protein n=1 Tax=Stenotrophomonas maltophilia TaxID=40324 RepID=A0A7V8JLQ7_STEMA|nr:MAG: hypothetical protein GAK31_02489 [Stenotrophomonas maltophilia]
MTEWFHAEGNRQQGPVPAGQLVELFRGNQISLDTLVWREGMPQWQPLRSVVDELGLIIPAIDAPPLPAPAAPYPPRCRPRLRRPAPPPRLSPPLPVGVCPTARWRR